MGIRDVLDETFDLYKSNFASLLAIVAVVQVPIGALSLFLLSRSGADPYSSSQLPYAALAFASNFLIAAPATWAISEAYLGRRPSASAAYRTVVRRALPFVETYLIWLVTVTAPMVVAVALSLIGALVVLAPFLHGSSAGGTDVVAGAVCVFALGAGAMAIWALIYVWLVFAPVAFVVEDKRHLSALKRSREMVRGHWWRVFGTILLVLFVISVVHAALVTPLRFLVGGGPGAAAGAHYLVVMAFSIIVVMLVWPIPLITTILLYYDLRIRKEGFDLQMLAKEMQVSRPLRDDRTSPEA